MWRKVKLGEVAKVIAGQSPQGEHYNKEGKGTPFYQGKKDYGERYLSEPTVWTSVVTKLAEGGDILMSVRAPVGALNIAPQRVCIGRGLAAIRANSEVHRDFLFYALSSLVHKLEGSAGAIFNSVNKKQIEDIEISIPSLAEQQRIVAKLDAAFAEIDRAIEIAEQRLSFTEDAFGKIVDAEFDVIRRNFLECRLGDVVSSFEYGTSTKCHKIGRFPVLRMGNMQSGKFKLDDLVYLDDESELRKYSVSVGDVFFNRTNSPLHVGKSAIYEHEHECLFAGYLIRLNFSANIVDGWFLNYYLNSPRTRQFGYGVMTSSVNQANINASKLKSYPYLRVDLKNQKEISRKLHEVESLFDEAVNNLKRIRQLYTSLKSALLTQELQPSEAA
jgi:type I restriction enzyme S subunit